MGDLSLIRTLPASFISLVSASSFSPRSRVLTPTGRIDTHVSALTPARRPPSINVQQSPILLHVNNLSCVISIYVRAKPKPEWRIWFLVCLSRVFRSGREGSSSSEATRLGGTPSISTRNKARLLKGVGSRRGVRVTVSCVCIATELSENPLFIQRKRAKPSPRVL